MEREEALKILASSCIPGSKQTEALETLIPELKELVDKNKNEKYLKELINFHRGLAAGNTQFVPTSSHIAWAEYLESILASEDEAAKSFGDYNKDRIAGRKEVLDNPEQFGLQRKSGRTAVTKNGAVYISGCEFTVND